MPARKIHRAAALRFGALKKIQKAAALRVDSPGEIQRAEAQCFGPLYLLC